jgi:hypothetical protein
MPTLFHRVHFPADLLEALAERTGHFWSDLENEAAAVDAVRAWLNPAPAAPAQQPAAGSDAGYQWKQLFLPEGTRLRASFGRQPWFAVVEGAQIKYGASAISPSGFANLHGSGHRNAWKAVWLRFPGSDEWLLADVCRQARQAAIARMIGDDAQLRRRAPKAHGQRQGQGKPKKQKPLRWPRAAVPQPPAERLSAPVAAFRNGTPGKDSARQGGRRKRRLSKHAP